MVQQKRDIREAMQSLSKTNLLKLEDILPFFPDFVLIDDFKDEICTALEGYNEDIDALKAELSEAISSAESIRIDIRGLKNRFVLLLYLRVFVSLIYIRFAKIPVTQTCQLCSLPCLIRQFYVFPCRHVFHGDCLTNFVQILFS
jgi:hypothetical protein